MGVGLPAGSREVAEEASGRPGWRGNLTTWKEERQEPGAASRLGASEEQQDVPVSRKASGLPAAELGPGSSQAGATWLPRWLGTRAGLGLGSLHPSPFLLRSDAQCLHTPGFPPRGWLLPLTAWLHAGPSGGLLARECQALPHPPPQSLSLGPWSSSRAFSELCSLSHAPAQARSATPILAAFRSAIQLPLCPPPASRVQLLPRPWACVPAAGEARWQPVPHL